MEVLIRWERLLEEVRPYYPKAGKGRVPYELESMLPVHCMQLFYNLSDPATEDVLYEIEKVRRFTGISLKKVPDETTILNFRHLLERHGLSQVLFESIKEYLSEEGLMLREGTIVDASASWKRPPRRRTGKENVIRRYSWQARHWKNRMSRAMVTQPSRCRLWKTRLQSPGSCTVQQQQGMWNR